MKIFRNNWKAVFNALLFAHPPILLSNKIKEWGCV